MIVAAIIQFNRSTADHSGRLNRTVFTVKNTSNGKVLFCFNCQFCLQEIIEFQIANN